MNLPQPKSLGRFSPQCLFRPQSVAVVGAATPAGRRVLASLRAGGFPGAILAVDESASSIAEAQTYPNIASLPFAPDLAVIAGEGDAVAGDAAALASRGVFAGIVPIIAGDLAKVARTTGMRLLGPGSFGVAVPEIGLNATLSHLVPPKGRLALVSQSVSLCRAVLDWAEPNGVGFSHVVGIGGNADVGFGMVLDWLSHDPGTGPILLDIRRIKDSRAFLSAARAASRRRPVVAIRAGGRLSDPSGDADRALAAALLRAGVLSVSRFEDLLAAAETLSRARPIRNEALAIVTNAAGPGQFAADAALRDGLRLARLDPTTIAAARSRLPDGDPVPAEGPIHVGPGPPGRLAEIAAILCAAPEVGGVLAVHAPTGAGDAAAIEALGACAGALRTTLLVCAMGETTGAAHRRCLVAAGVPVFASPEQAVGGFRHLVDGRRSRAAARELPPNTVLTLSPDRAAVRSVFGRVRRQGRLALTQDEALDVLSAYGIPTVPTRAVAGADDAADAAALLGLPAVVKLRRCGPPAEPARELLIRVTEDATFGPVIGFGHGGTAAEILDDVAVDLPPLNLALARALIGRTRAGVILDELRDRPAADSEAVAEALVRVSQLVVDFPEIDGLAVNPLFADADGVTAVDGWMRLRRAAAAPSRLAITPYPSDLIEQWDAGGEVLTIRPIRPEDAAAHAALFARLSPDDVRFRFFTAMRALSAEQIARLTQVDYDREMAFIAARPSSGETVGVARLVREPEARSAEFAVAVQSDMKGKGLASRLMQRLVDWARACGVGEIVGQVLADNAPMLAFVRHLGFEIHRAPGEDDALEARLRLDGVASEPG